VLAGAAAAAGLYFSGFGWRFVALPSGLALLQSAVLNIAVITTFALVQAGLWLLAGRPDGPERRLVEAANSFVPRLPRLRSMRGLGR
jgi:hypothetical protein